MLIFEDDFPLADFLENRREFERKTRLKTKLDIAEAVQIGITGTKSKKGIDAFNAWAMYTQKAINHKPEKVLTLFEKMKMERNQESIFNRLRRKQGA